MLVYYISGGYGNDREFPGSCIVSSKEGCETFREGRHAWPCDAAGLWEDIRPTSSDAHLLSPLILTPPPLSRRWFGDPHAGPSITSIRLRLCFLPGSPSGLVPSSLVLMGIAGCLKSGSALFRRGISSTTNMREMDGKSDCKLGIGICHDPPHHYPIVWATDGQSFENFRSHSTMIDCVGTRNRFIFMMVEVSVNFAPTDLCRTQPPEDTLPSTFIFSHSTQESCAVAHNRQSELNSI